MYSWAITAWQCVKIIFFKNFKKFLKNLKYFKKFVKNSQKIFKKISKEIPAILAMAGWDSTTTGTTWLFLCKGIWMSTLRLKCVPTTAVQEISSRWFLKWRAVRRTSRIEWTARLFLSLWTSRRVSCTCFYVSHWLRKWMIVWSPSPALCWQSISSEQQVDFDRKCNSIEFGLRFAGNPRMAFPLQFQDQTEPTLPRTW